MLLLIDSSNKYSVLLSGGFPYRFIDISVFSIDELSQKTQAECDFCRFQNFTAMDPLGRIVNRLSFTAANTFKLDRWHALVLLKAHHPLNWTREQFIDLVTTTQQW